MRKGTTLLELLIGAGVFATVLTLVVLSLQLSHQTLEASNRLLPVEISLQNAMDSMTRYIRQSKDVEIVQGPSLGPSSCRPLLGQPTLCLTKWDGSCCDTLVFVRGELIHDGNVLLKSHYPDSIISGNFQVEDGDVAKIVNITLLSFVKDSYNKSYSKVLVSSVSLRNVPPGISLAPTQLPPPAQPPPAAPPILVVRPVGPCNPCPCGSRGPGCSCPTPCP